MQWTPRGFQEEKEEEGLLGRRRRAGGGVPSGVGKSSV